MTREETGRLFAEMKVLYPAAYQKRDPKEVKLGIATWQAVLKDLPAQVVFDALYEYARESDNSFPPTPPDIFRIVNKHVSAKDRKRILSKSEAWEKVDYVMKHTDMKYDSQKAFDALPESIKKAIGSARTLREWATTDISKLQYIKRDFLENYEEIVKLIEEELSSSRYTLSHLDENIKKIDTKP